MKSRSSDFVLNRSNLDFVQNRIFFLIKFIPDILALSLAAWLTYYLRFSKFSFLGTVSPFISSWSYSSLLAFLVCIWIIIFFLGGVYSFTHSNLFLFNFRMVLRLSLIYFFILGFVSFLVKASFSRMIFLLMLLLGIFFLFFFRLLIFYTIIRRLVLKKVVFSKLIIIGRDKIEIETYSDWLIANRKLGFTIASRFVCDSISAKWIEEFDKIIGYKKISEVLLLPGMESDPNFSKFIHYCEDLDINVNWIPLDSGNIGYWLIPTPQEGIPFLTFEKSEISIPWRIVKRIFDLVFSIILMVLLSPVFLAIAIAVLVSSGWPVFYSQTRIGKHGKPFKFYKFRSMVKDADKQVEVQLSTNSSTRDASKRADDPRITRVGRILRKYSLDELPQFLNVFLGSMSVVGPRPAVAKEVNQYNSIYERRLIAKPGITGPWQISGRSDLDLRTSVALDLNYLINWSFTRDLWIIISTIGAVFRGKGAY